MYYKILLAGQSAHGGTFTWSLPSGDRPGEWTPEIAEPVICTRGYHLTTTPMRWPVIGMAVYEAEPHGVAAQEGDKIVTSSCRLLRAAPEMIPDWWHAAERFVAAEIPAIPWLRPQGRPDPAWRTFAGPTLGAAWDAARDVARGAAWGAARGAAWGAARGAAWGAARGAAWDAAWDAARGAARDVARDAAWDAARDVARDAAWDAARDAQLAVILHICDGLPLAAEHRAHIAARWEVWRRGYALLCDVDGVLYVYAATGS